MSIFACPVCGAALSRNGGACVCPNGHSYDVASEGYVYLLPPNKKHSKAPGDDREMVAARRRFLEGGWYAAFSSALNAAALRCLPESGARILDVGCGEGYYTGRLARFLAESGKDAEISAFDISKDAVKAAARKYKDVFFAVGSAFGIPVLPASADLVTDVFAPIVPEELARAAKPGGTLILAVPGKRHLYGLKEILYDEPYENEMKDTKYEGFAFQERIPVRGRLDTDDPRVIRDLFEMTPYAWKTPWEGREKLKTLGRLQTELEFDFLIYRRL